MNLNKVVLYILVMLIYLGLSKSFSPSEFGISYILNEKSLSELVKGAPVTTILVDMHSTGFLIKTYYHKYKIVYGFQSVDEIIVRTSSQFAEKHKDNIGMSIFRRYEEDLREEHTPLPPGALFVGNKSFGDWVPLPSGIRVWRFYRAYRNIPSFLGIKGYEFTYDTYQKMQLHRSQNKAFYGPENEFGTKGSWTQKRFPRYFARQKPEKINFKKFFYDYFRENFYQR